MRTKTLVISVLLLLPAVSFSQTERGKYIISGKSSIELVRNNSTWSNNGTPDPGAGVDMSSFKAIAGVGYFIADNFALGLSGHYSHTVEASSKMNEIVLMPTLMYFIPSNSALRLYAQIAAGYANTIENNSGSKDLFSGPAYGGGIGLAYFINSSIAVDLGIQLVGTKLTYSENENFKIKGSSLGSAIGLTLVF